ncbi:MAG: DNA polymerase domain-containing protein [Candidatus Kariarchaeaceae archaeon]|jgi:DNA polymerase I
MRKRKWIPKKINHIALCWADIPTVTELKEGLVLEGYFADEHRGYYLVLYDPDNRELVQWLDQSVIPTVRHMGKVPSSSSDKPIKYVKMHDLIREKEVMVSEVPTSYSTIRKNNNINERDYPKVDQSASQELTYFQKRQLTPGTWVSIANNKLYQMDRTYNSEQSQEVRKKLMGESEEIIELCQINIPGFDAAIPNVKRVAFDIEIKVQRGIFPSPQVAEFPVLSIACYDLDGKATQFIYGFTPTATHHKQIEDNLGYQVEIKAYVTERKMLEEFFEYIRTYPIVLSYNGDQFDLLYLDRRASRLGVVSPIREGIFRMNTEYHFKGSIHVDLFRFFNNEAIRIYAYGAKYNRTRLDDVAQALLGRQKVQHDLWFDEMSAVNLITYNIVDVQLTLELTTYSDNLTWNLMVTLMRVGKMTLGFVNRESISKWIVNWVAFEHRRRRAILPSRTSILAAKGDFESTPTSDGKQYKGAIVLDPKPGMYWKAVVTDFASLYPSVIKKYRLSYETLRCNHSECEYNKVPGLNHWVCTKQFGIMSSLVGFVRDVRVRWYKPRTDDSDEKIAQLADTVQNALKVFINAAYGVFGNERFALYCPPVAESVTAYARDAMLEANRMAEKIKCEVLYGDTDSIFLHNPTNEQLQKLTIWSVVELGIELTKDYEFRILVLSDRKKNYFGVTTKDKMVVKGLQVKKRNTAIFIQETFEEIKKILIDIHTEEDLQSAKVAVNRTIQRVISELKEGKIQLKRLAQMATLNKPFHEYRAKSDAVQVAIQMATPENQEEFIQGSQFMIIKVKPFDVIVKTKLFKNFKLGRVVRCTVREIGMVKDYARIDLDKYEDLLKNAFTPILDSLDITWSQIEGYGYLDSMMDYDEPGKNPLGFETIPIETKEWNSYVSD